ncbi:MAG: type pilus assembly protein PilB, partial [Solirubrobacteraceae bacterium]|nr:type pilus assembly protein PilB [Solirubrobacteraceae bacterium]
MTPPRPEGPTHKFLSDALVARGAVTQRAMDAALLASRSGRRYSEILLGNGDVSDDDLARTLADHHRIDHVDLDVFPIDLDVKAMVSADTARRVGALPVALLPTGEVVVALYDPEALSNMAEITKRIGREIRPVVASRSQVERHIADLASQPRRTAQAPAAAAPPAPAVSAPAPAAVAPPVAEAGVLAADDRAHIAEERSRIADRARALAQYRDEMPAGAADPSQTWAPAPEHPPQAHANSHVTVPSDHQRQAA